VNVSRSFIYTTAPPAAAAAAALAALEVLRQEPERRQRLWDLVRWLHGALRGAGFDIGRTQTPIVPILLGDSERTMQTSGALLERGFYVQGIRPPTVPQGQARLRLTVTSEHRREDLERLVEALTVLHRRGAGSGGGGV
jgi:7-keto-8-aminopelargonate synthetase-like enzyme